MDSCSLPPRPLRAQPGPKPKTLQVKVWVNTATQVYHCPSDADYGSTKEGEYMSEAAARGSGHRGSRGNGCKGEVTPNPLPGGGVGKVWVNTVSRVYNCPKSRSYGKTERGRFMSEEEALAAGHRPAGNKRCRR